MHNRHLSKTEIIARGGWDAALIDSLLGRPDRIKHTLGRRYPTQLYLTWRVEAAEEGRAFWGFRAPDQVPAKKGALIQQIDDMPIFVDVVPPAEVIQAAVDEYNLRAGHIALNDDSDAEVILRVTVEHIARHCVKFDRALLETAEKTGQRTAVTRIRERAFDAISKAYPELKHVAARQLQARIDLGI